MGSVVSSQKVDERFLTPQRLPKDCRVNLKTVKKKILKGELAQFYTPVECEAGQLVPLEECPICFHNFPGINYFQCCNNAICTECYIHVMSSSLTLDAACPFCKKQSPSVKFRLRSAKERQEQLVQEQAVIAAQLQARKNEDDRSAREAAQRMQNTGGASASTRQAPNSDAAAQRPSISSTAAAIARAQLDLDHSRVSNPSPARPAGSERQRTTEQQQSRPPDLSNLVPQNLWSMGMSDDEMNDFMLNEAMAASMRDASAAAQPQTSSTAPNPPTPYPTTPTTRIEALQALIQNLTIYPSSSTVSQTRARTPPPALGPRASSPSTLAALASMWNGQRVDIAPPRTAPPRDARTALHDPILNSNGIMNHVDLDARLEEMERELLRHAIVMSLLESEDTSAEAR